MNILYILGNGFDLAQGMKTSYPDFYDYLANEVENKSPLLTEMIKGIESDTENWADMEKALGQFSAGVDDPKEFTDFCEELKDKLQEYLQRQEDFSFSDEAMGEFQKEIVNPSKNLRSQDRMLYEQFKQTLDSPTAIRVMTFNYTKTFEKFFYDPQNTVHNPFKIVPKEVIHVHGLLNDSFILGVDNESQIANESFRGNNDVRDWLLKSQSDSFIDESWAKSCQSFINEANVIFLYGVSFGETDNEWWELIAKQLKTRNDVVVILYAYRRDLNNGNRQKLGKFYREQIYEYLKYFNISKEKYDGDYNDRLFFISGRPVFIYEGKTIPLKYSIDEISLDGDGDNPFFN